MLRGRDFAAGDGEAMLISASAAKLLWGTRIRSAARTTLPLMSRTLTVDVVGMVGDVKEQLAEKAPPTVYYYKRDMPFGDFVARDAHRRRSRRRSPGRSSPRVQRTGSRSCRSRRFRRWTT